MKDETYCQVSFLFDVDISEFLFNLVVLFICNGI